ncbi:WXG100-like domain-containing protein [Micromonospora rubida]|uniref:WXG100-like domain-containing protein n=1 Tax=Micromonospora rubida TaxID=2697657 RepID=UPI001378E23E|nr:hypothetical protein [Micromonospora rubida]NBE80766.1 hypothetical protein [Micromonospora rubida]
MGLQLPAELTEPLSWIGLEWPQADEELLFAAGQQWLTFGLRLQTTAETGNGAARAVWERNQGETVDAFHAWWTRDDGPQPRLTEDEIAAQLIGASLIVFAAITLFMKIAFIVQLIILLVQVTMAIAAAVATFGASTATIPGFVAATRLACRQLLKQVVKQVQTLLKELLERARKLLKRARNAGPKRAPKTGPDGIPPRITDGPRMPTQQMNPHYRTETDPTKPPFPGQSVRYLDDAEREAHRVVVGRDGQLYRSDGTLFDTTAGSSVHAGGGGRAIFVMDERGNLYASNYQAVGDFHHSSFLGGQPVAGAGEIEVVNGRLQLLTDRSGHYMPGRSFTDQVAANLRDAGAPPFRTSYMAPKGT